MDGIVWLLMGVAAIWLIGPTEMGTDGIPMYP